MTVVPCCALSCLVLPCLAVLSVLVYDACWQVVCRVCSDYKAPLRYLTYKPDRVCKSCFEQLRQGKYVCTITHLS